MSTIDLEARIPNNVGLADDRRLQRWLSGTEDAPPWFERVLLVLYASLTAGRVLMRWAELAEAPTWVRLELAILGDVLENYTGDRHGFPPMPAIETLTCRACGAVTANPHDIREGYCARCHDWTRDRDS